MQHYRKLGPAAYGMHHCSQRSHRVPHTPVIATAANPISFLSHILFSTALQHMMS